LKQARGTSQQKSILVAVEPILSSQYNANHAHTHTHSPKPPKSVSSLDFSIPLGERHGKCCWNWYFQTSYLAVLPFAPSPQVSAQNEDHTFAGRHTCTMSEIKTWLKQFRKLFEVQLRMTDLSSVPRPCLATKKLCSNSYNLAMLTSHEKASLNIQNVIFFFSSVHKYCVISKFIAYAFCLALQ